MANKRLDPVSYRRFEVDPLLPEGLLAVPRDGGDLERRVAQGMARLADQFNDRADREAERAGELAGRRAALEGRPEPGAVTGGETTGGISASGSASAGTGIVATASGSGVDLAKSILRKEEGFRDTPYFDVNAHRVGYGSDTTVRADGRVVRVTPGLTVTRDDAERDLDHRLSNVEGARVREQLGETWARLPANIQGALLSVGYNYGSLPAAVVSAVRSGGVEAIASAVSGLDSNPERRQREAAIIRGGAPAAGDNEPSYARIPAASVAPIKVTPVGEPATFTRGRAGTFRPTGRDTIYGRAYDVAGTRTYLEELDLTMRQDQANVYETYKNDPAMLEKALGELETAHMRESVFEEIAPEYSAAFRKNSFVLVERAKREKEERDRAEARVSFLDRVGEYETRKSQAMAGYDPSNPETASALADVQASIDAHYDSAVARQILTPAEAERAKRESRSDMTVGFYVKQAASRRPEEIAALRKRMEADFAAGKLAEVTGEDWDKINSGLVAMEKARITQDAQADRALSLRGDELAKKIAAGQPVTPEEIARFQLDAGTAPKGAQIVQSTLARMRVSDAIRKLPIGEVEKQLPSLLKGPDGSTRPDDLEHARKAIANHKKELEADPLGVAERFGVIKPVEPLPIGAGVTVDAAESAFAARIASADSVAEHFGVRPRYFRPEEIRQVNQMIVDDPDAAASFAAGVVSSAGSKAPAVLREFGDKAPGMDQAGTLMVLGGNPDAARDLLAGYGKTAEGKAYPEYPANKRQPVSRDVFGEAMVFDQGMARKLEAGATSIARKRLYDAGIDPKSDDAKPIYRQALSEAAGATFVSGVQFGGFAAFDPGWRWSPQQVVVPVNVRADRFVDVVGALTDADLGGVSGGNGKAWRASDFQNAMPVRVNGGHVFALDDPASGSPQFIADASGKPIVLDFEGELGARLKSRVPEAFR